MSRCDFTDLDTASCAHCLGHHDPDQRAAAIRAELIWQPGWLIAQYPGRCSGCGEFYQAGAAIRRNGAGGWLAGGWTAECCAEEQT